MRLEVLVVAAAHLDPLAAVGLGQHTTSQHSFGNHHRQRMDLHLHQPLVHLWLLEQVVGTRAGLHLGSNDHHTSHHDDLDHRRDYEHPAGLLALTLR